MPENTDHKNSFLIIIHEIEYDRRSKYFFQDQFLPVPDSGSRIQFMIPAELLYFTVNFVSKAISTILIKAKFNVIRYIRNIIN